MQSFVKKNRYPLLIALIVLVIGIINFTPGVFITGWDTLHPEFDFGLNFSRLINGVWREEQGLGAVAGHSHMADLPRVIFLWFFHFILPLSSLKYVYLLWCLLLGPLGMYYLVKFLLGSRVKGQGKSPKPFTLYAVPFLSALFYLFNLGTVQQFYLPFEMFPTQYAYLPWIIFSSLKYLKEKKVKDLLLFSVFTLLATPQAYAAHLWYAFFGVYLVFLACYTLFHRPFGQNIKRSIILVVFTILINSFWLFPNVYYIFTSSSIPKESKQNRIYSQEYLLRNREHGYLKNVALVKGFYFNWSIYDFKKENFALALDPWVRHSYEIPIRALGYIFFTLSALGLGIGLFKKDRLFLSLSPFFILPFIILMNHTFPFDKLFDLLLKVSLLEEALRFVFTKFSILLVFGYTIFFALSLRLLFDLFKTRVRLIIILFSTGLILYCLPFFQGQLISPHLKTRIPQEYFDFYNFMEKRPQGTVLSLPLHSFSGWQYQKWGYQGSGFLWFGLKQNLLDRDSDRWSVANEQAFREFQYSLYSRNVPFFQSTLEKYNIHYIVWDKNVVAPLEKNRSQIVFTREISEFLKDIQKRGTIKKIGTYGNLEVYENKWLRLGEGKLTTKILVSPPYRWSPFDSAFFLNGNYVNNVPGEKELEEAYFPFRSLITTTDRARKDLFQIDPQTNSYYLQGSVPKTATSLFTSNYTVTEKALYTNVYVEQISKGSYGLLFQPLLPKGLADDVRYPLSPLQLTTKEVTISLNGNAFTFAPLSIDPQNPLYVGQSILYTNTPNYLNNEPITISFKQAQTTKNTNALFSKFPLRQISLTANQIFKKNKKEDVELEGAGDNVHIALSAKSSRSGVFVDLSSLPHNLGYVVITTSRNVEGMPLRMCLRNLYSKICSFYDELSKSSRFTEDYFFIPPSDEGIGYGLSLDNISYGNYNAKNQLKSVTVLALPYTFLSQLHYTTNKDSKEVANVYYLNQSYQNGWKAYANGKELKDHIMVNNWANGWLLPENSNIENSKISVVFWPQRLEFIGFGLIALSFLVILLRLRKRT